MQHAACSIMQCCSATVAGRCLVGHGSQYSARAALSMAEILAAVAQLHLHGDPSLRLLGNEKGAETLPSCET